MWNAVKPTTATEFTKLMNKMKEKDEAAYKCLMDVDTFHWCTHAFSLRPKCDKLLNNILE